MALTASLLDWSTKQTVHACKVTVIAVRSDAWLLKAVNIINSESLLQFFYDFNG